MDGRIWGCRGSLATPGPATLRYGGNTSCVELRPAAGGVVVLDAGTGIRGLGLALKREGVRQVDLLLTHLHLDHIEGLGFFAQLFDAGATIDLWGPRAETPLEARIRTYLSPPYFPVPFDAIPATIRFHELWDERWQLHGLDVVAAPVCHPGPTLGYRVSENGRSLAYVCDNEPALERSSGAALAAGADLLLHDAQYTDEEYTTRRGWGHSSLSAFAEVVRSAEPKRALMFHHDPGHDDEKLEEMRTAARELTGRDDVDLAAEGATLFHRV